MKHSSILTHTVAAMVMISSTRAQADDHGDTLATATRITAPDTPGHLETATDEDWFKIVVTSPGRHWIYSTGHVDTEATLYSATGAYITANASGGSRHNFEIDRVLGTGTYYLRVTSEGTISGTGGYGLSVRCPEFAVSFSGPNLASSLADPGEIQLYRLTTPVSGLNWIYSTGFTNTSATLYDSNGNYITANSSGGSGANFLIDHSFAADTLVYLMVRIASFSSPLGDFTLSWRHGANAIPFEGTRKSGSIGVAGDLDLYRIEVPVASPLWVFTTGITDVSATLYDTAWGYVTANNSSGAGNNFLISRSLSAGTYWLLVGQGSATSSTGPYTLNVRQTSTAIPINQSGVSAYQIDPAGDHDLFVFETTGGLARFTSLGTTDVSATLMDQGGNYIIANDNGGVGANFLIERTLTAGRYHLLVTGSSLSFNTGAYQLDASIAGLMPVATLSSTSSQVVGAGSLGVSIETTGDWSVSNLPAWVSASSLSGTGSAEITFTLDPNHSNGTRRASIRIGGLDYVITQEPADGASDGSTQPSLAIFPAVILAIPTEVGRTYRIEQSTDMVQWQDTGIEFIGNGQEMSAAVERIQAKAFFRAVID